jgi:transcriptional regulator with XRE-family HTH domain
VSESLLTRAQVGARIRQERQRLGLSQSDFAQLAMVSRRTQASYEAGEGSPVADYLLAVAGAGVDILYVVTGSGDAASHPVVQPERRTWRGGPPNADEGELLAGFRRLKPADQAALRQIIGALAARG